MEIFDQKQTWENVFTEHPLIRNFFDTARFYICIKGLKMI